MGGASKTVAMTIAVQAVGGGLAWSVVPALLPAMGQDLALSHASAGLVWGAASLGIAVASPVGGAAIDRFGARKVATAALLFGALACAARALAHGPVGFAATMFFFGLHIGFTAPAVPKALAGVLPLAKVAAANGAAVLGYTLGTAATLLFARTAWLPLFGSWRTMMIAIAALVALVALAWGVLVEDGIAPKGHARIGDAIDVGRSGSMRRLASMHFLLFGGYLALLGLLPRALGEAHLAPASIGRALAGWLVAAGVANVLGPLVAERRSARRAMLVGGPIVAATALFGVAVAPAHAQALLLVAALGGGCIAPLLLTMPLELREVGPARAGAAIGLLGLVGQLGGFLLPVLAGVMAERMGTGAALAALAGAHALIPAFAWGLGRGEASRAITTGEVARAA